MRDRGEHGRGMETSQSALGVNPPVDSRETSGGERREKKSEVSFGFGIFTSARIKSCPSTSAMVNDCLDRFLCPILFQLSPLYGMNFYYPFYLQI
jgi:hypothetical protein